MRPAAVAAARHHPRVQTWRFSGGPKRGGVVERVEVQINAWPARLRWQQRWLVPAPSSHQNRELGVVGLRRIVPREPYPVSVRQIHAYSSSLVEGEEEVDSVAAPSGILVVPRLADTGSLSRTPGRPSRAGGPPRTIKDVGEKWGLVPRPPSALVPPPPPPPWRAGLRIGKYPALFQGLDFCHPRCHRQVTAEPFGSNLALLVERARNSWSVSILRYLQVLEFGDGHEFLLAVHQLTWWAFFLSLRAMT
jgi:hypothetical protein